MTQEKFNDAIIRQMDLCGSILMTKGMEYAPAALTDMRKDRLAHFKTAAFLMNTSAKAALFGMLSKHLVSIAQMCMEEKAYSVQQWEEKITDSVNYLFILRAMVEEEAYEEN